jgi:hypothetical protein
VSMSCRAIVVALVSVVGPVSALSGQARPAVAERGYVSAMKKDLTPFDVRIEEEGRYRLVVWNPSTDAPTKIVQLQHTQVDCTD